MKKKITIGLIIVGIIVSVFIIKGCTTIKPNYIIFNDEKIDCARTPTIWWGEKGTSPENNNIWKCEDWILVKQKDL